VKSFANIFSAASRRIVPQVKALNNLQLFINLSLRVFCFVTFGLAKAALAMTSQLWAVRDKYDSLIDWGLGVFHR
jgi:hypothetical protein